MKNGKKEKVRGKAREREKKKKERQEKPERESGLHDRIAKFLKFAHFPQKKTFLSGGQKKFAEKSQLSILPLLREKNMLPVVILSAAFKRR